MKTRIVKIGKNNVEKRKVLREIDTEEEVIMSTKPFGHDRVDKEILECEEKIANLKSSKWRADKIVEYETELSELQDVKTALVEIDEEIVINEVE